MKAFFFAAALVAATAAAARAEAAVNTSTSPVPSEKNIDVLDPTPNMRPYKVLGIATVRVNRHWTTQEAALEKLKAKARDMGGDALINLNMEAVTRLEHGTSTRTGRDEYSAKVIAWTDGK